jgi:hypothetical protein
MPPLRVVGLLVALSELGNQAIMLDRTAVLGFAVELRKKIGVISRLVI